MRASTFRPSLTFFHRASSRPAKSALTGALLAAAIALPSVAAAHECGPSKLTIGVGAANAKLYRMITDVNESGPSHYELSINQDPTVVAVSPDNVDSLFFGEFKLVGLKPGTITLTFEWSYEPNQAAGFCVVQVEVTAAAPPTSAANMPDSNVDSDPVNTYTGEFLYEPASDLGLGGPMPVTWRRYYASGLAADTQLRSGLGNTWSHPYAARLYQLDATSINVVTWKGRILPFTDTGANWSLAIDEADPYQLVETGSGYAFFDPNERLRYDFDADGYLTAVSDGKGNVHTVTAPAGRVSSISDGLGRTITLTYSGFNEIVSATDGTRTVRYTYDFGGNLATFTDADGKVWTYNYDFADLAAGRLTSEVRPSGNTPVVNTYDAEGRVVSQVDPDSNQTTYNYAGATTTVTDPLGFTRVFTHDAGGRLTAISDELGAAIQYAYDTDGNLIRITDRNGGQTDYTYAPGSNGVATVTFPDASAKSFSYGSRTVGGITYWDLSGVVHQDGTTESFVHDGAGNLTSRTDGEGSTWTYTYDGHAQVETATNPTLATTTYAYNLDGTLASITDASSNATTFTYDGLKRRLTTSHPDGTTRTFARDGRNHVTSVTNERGGVHLYGYDDNGNLATHTNPGGQTSTSHYDTQDRLTGETDTAGNDSFYEYDERGWMMRMTYRDGSSVTFERDGVGNLVGLRDADGNLWARAFDPEGVPVSQSTPAGETTLYAPDLLGRQTASTTPRGNTTAFEYDAVGHPTAVDTPGGRRLERTYDGRGDEVSIAHAGSGAEVALTRNALGRITQVSDPNGGMWTRGWDTQGRVTSVTDPLGRERTLTYDARDRVATVTYPDAIGSVTLSYDGLNARTRKLYSDGTDIGYTYDAGGRLSGASGVSLGRDTEGNIVESNGITMTRNEEGLIDSMTLAPGKTVTYGYNTRNQLDSVSDWAGATVSFDYDTVGRLTTITRSNGVTTTIGYDADSRIVSIDEGVLSSIALTRDVDGRVVTRERTPLPTFSLPAGDQTASYDAAHQLVGATHDPRGRMTADGNSTYGWDLASRLENVTRGALDVSMTYDAFDQMLSVDTGAEQRTLVWNYGTGIPTVHVERTGGVDQTYHVTTPGGRLLYSVDAAGGARRWHHFDENGNTLLVTDDAGSTVTAYAYGPYGETLAGNVAVTAYGWQGAWGVRRLADEDLYYMRARWYDAARGRFLTPDPLTTVEPLEINPYQYALGDPIRYADPLGLRAVTVQPEPTPATQPSTQPPPAPGSSPDNPIYLTESEWREEVDRTKDKLKREAAKAEWGMIDPQIPATFDSGYLRRQREYFDFRGQVMNGGEMNYYFQGMYWAELGVPKTVMNAIIHGYKQYKYGRGPSANDLFAACQGFEDNGNFFTEVRNEFNDRVDDITSVPRRIGDAVTEKVYDVYYWLNPSALPTGPPSILPR